MATKALVKKPAAKLAPEIMIDVLVKGKIDKLTDQQKLDYLLVLCERYGLDPSSKPFAFVKNTKTGEVFLYATRDCTDQLRKACKISITVKERVYNAEAGVVSVSVVADWNGRVDEALGVVSILTKRTKDECGQGESPGWVMARGVDVANAMMKAETKAKRRVTLSIAGLGMLDETELETVAGIETKPDKAEPYASPAQLGHLERLGDKILPDLKAAQAVSPEMLSEKQAAEIIGRHAVMA